MNWDFPFWVAHRGAGKLAPENTLAAFRLGSQHGYRAFECDVKLSADGQLFLLHDSTLTRTTGYRGPDPLASAHTWAVLSKLDAGAWHSRAYAGEPMPTLEAIARCCQHNGARLNIEVKPSPGREAETGQAVAKACRELWRGRTDWPLLSSFQTQALAAAQEQAPEVPRGLLVDVWRDQVWDDTQQLGCSALVLNYSLWDAPRVQTAHETGLRALSYTVNDEWAAQHLVGLGTDGIITDRVDLFAP